MEKTIRFPSTKRTATVTRAAILSLGLCVALGSIQSNVAAAELLTIGSEAPKLDVEHWVQDGKGQFKPVTDFEKDRVYVVEFWATWCGPCIASMPHLAQLQKDYAPKGVQIVSISDEDLETVEKFLERKVRGAEAEEGKEPPTYRELTSAYCLTTDPDQSSYEDYMRAAAQNGIPTAFIVGKDAKVEWIGHPMEIDEPLSQVVEGSWDRESFKEEMVKKQQAEKAMQEIFALLNEDKLDEAMELIDANLKENYNSQLSMLKLQVLLVGKKMDAAGKHLDGLYKAIVDSPMETNMVAWNIYEMARQGRIEDADSMLEASGKAAATAAEKADKPMKASILDTAAHLYGQLGKYDEAIAIENKAIELAGPDDKEFMKAYLKELQDLKDGKKTDDKEEASETTASPAGEVIK